MTTKTIWESAKPYFTEGEMQAMQEIKQKVMDHRSLLAGSQLAPNYAIYQSAEDAKTTNNKKGKII